MTKERFSDDDQYDEFRLIVCGGRQYGWQWKDGQLFPDQQQQQRLYQVLDAMVRAVDEQGRTRVFRLFHGAASGADTLAERWAVERGIDSVAYPADWTKHGRAAGPIRNETMLKESNADVVVAFNGGRGTSHMIRLAKKANVPVYEVK